jgi:hypothetical protein
MSKEKPEVGDVFESPFVRYMVLMSTEVYAHCLVDDNGLEIRNIPTFYLKEKCKYLGKSKVSIEELFDVAED